MVQNAAAPALSSENELKLLTHQTAVDVSLKKWFKEPILMNIRSK